MRRSAIPPRGGTTVNRKRSWTAGAPARLTICAALLCAVASAGVAMDLSEMPPWLRAMIQPVHLGAAAEVETVQVGATGAPAPAVGTVRAPTMGDGGTVGVGAPAAAHEWSQALGGIEGLDRETLAKAGHMVARIEEEGMTPGAFADWALASRTTAEELTTGLVMAGSDWRRHYPQLGATTTALCEALYQNAGDDLSALGAVPPAGRLFLATYLAKHRADGVELEVMNSIEDAELAALPQSLLYRTSSHLMNDAPRSAVAVLMRYGTVLHSERMLCHELMLTCRYLDDRAVVEACLIPYAEAALRKMPPTDFWEQALIALIWGHSFCRRPDAAATEGLRWLRGAEALGIDLGGEPALRVKAQLGPALAQTDQRALGVEMLRDVLAHFPPSSEQARRAQACLMDALRRGDTAQAATGGGLSP